MSVDTRGCSLDKDNDKVVNEDDLCPGTPAGTEVDKYGCKFEIEIILHGLSFDTKSAQIPPEADILLDGIVKKMNQRPSMMVEVAGYTDTNGSGSYNLILSGERAAAVRQYLIDNGIAEDRLTSRGYGETHPIDDNSTDEGRRNNRRVSLRILQH